jgi:hypothetical protein
MATQSRSVRPKPRSAHNEPLEPCRQRVNTTTLATRQTNIIGICPTKREKNILKGSKLLIDSDAFTTGAGGLAH